VLTTYSKEKQGMIYDTGCQFTNEDGQGGRIEGKIGPVAGRHTPRVRTEK